MAFELNSEEESLKQAHMIKPRWNPLQIFVLDIWSAAKPDKLGREIAQIAFPAALALTADPIASLIDTGFIGKIGAVEQAAVGVSIAVFNQISKVFNFPLMSVTTSLVAEEDAVTEMAEEVSKPSIAPNSDEDCDREKSLKDVEAQAFCVGKDHTCGTFKDAEDSAERDESSIPFKDLEADDGDGKEEDCQKPAKKDVEVSAKMDETSTGSPNRTLPSVSSALVLGVVLGIIEAIILIAGATPILRIMGIHPGSPMKRPAEQYLRLRAMSAPAIVLSLAIQGVFRGFKDTKTPLYVTVAGNLCNIALDRLLIFTIKLGVSGAAIAHTFSQYFMAWILLWRLSQRVVLLPPKFTDLKFERFFKNGFLLLCRVTSVTFTYTLAASMAARLGTIQMAAFQICLQIWMATSLLADALALAGQAILATAFAKVDHDKVKRVAARTLQMGFVLGIFLAAMLGGILRFLARAFTKDVHVLKMMGVAIPFVAGTMPLNTMAFVFDGINFGASDFAFAAYSMISISLITVVCLIVLSPHWGFVGIWISLTILMTFRMIAGIWRIGTATGPWRFLRE